MAKNKKNIDSFNGFTFGVPEEKQPLPTQKEESPEPYKAVTREKQQTTLNNGMVAKKKGRPKVNRETKKRTSFTILPSLYKQASEIAYDEGKSVSELIEDFLKEYVNNH